jgi:hypothetical protein
MAPYYKARVPDGNKARHELNLRIAVALQDLILHPHALWYTIFGRSIRGKMAETQVNKEKTYDITEN